ncbi:hypothetical protein V2G26_014650 [Clonostachys chloroleuca]|uniref:Bromodomain associated domain-containing protein n=3 Tax=Clonostachys TaxID=110564 RepID=A0A9N9VUJ6_9HYPO|nr:unnamed protein product [Clonostachys byssicola]CAH0028635.1 unnamed protein product [Clonostachys rhizophaga]CAI6095510.1 unnamed protein product [Clonostachys chloroleuca]
MPAPTTLFHAFLRPSVLQILRATGYHACSPAVLDCVTDLAARYLSTLCEKTADHAVHNHGDAGDFSTVDIRMALQDLGALLPEALPVQQEWLGEEDLRGVEEFVKWFSGQRMKEIMDFAKGDGENDEIDYLHALKKRHNKTSDDAKFQGTILGKPADTGEIEVEGGGDIKSIDDWITQRTGNLEPSPSPKINGNGVDHRDARSPSSGLSSVGDRLGNEDVEMTTG